MSEIKLSHLQKAFCDAYLENGGDHVKAAITAGYARKYASTQGLHNLRHTAIRAYMADRLAAMENAKVMRSREVLERLTAIARGEVTEEVTIFQPREEGRGFIPVKDTRSVHPREQLRALELLGKINLLFVPAPEPEISQQQKTAMDAMVEALGARQTELD